MCWPALHDRLWGFWLEVSWQPAGSNFTNLFCCPEWWKGGWTVRRTACTCQSAGRVWRQNEQFKTRKTIFNAWIKRWFNYWCQTKWKWKFRTCMSKKELPHLKSDLLNDSLWLLIITEASQFPSEQLILFESVVLIIHALHRRRSSFCADAKHVTPALPRWGICRRAIASCNIITFHICRRRFPSSVLSPSHSHTASTYKCFLSACFAGD